MSILNTAGRPQHRRGTAVSQKSAPTSSSTWDDLSAGETTATWPHRRMTMDSRPSHTRNRSSNGRPRTVGERIASGNGRSRRSCSPVRQSCAGLGTYSNVAVSRPQYKRSRRSLSSRCRHHWPELLRNAFGAREADDSGPDDVYPCPAPTCVVCLGLGSIADSTKAQDQYIMLRELLEEMRNEVSCLDSICFRRLTL